VVCPPDAPLLGFLSLVMPAIATGNTVIAIPWEKYPLITGESLPSIRNQRSSDGVVNIVTAARGTDEDARRARDVDAIWCFTDETSAAAVNPIGRQPEAGVHQ